MTARESILRSRPVFFWECVEGRGAGVVVDATGRQPIGTFNGGTNSKQGGDPLFRHLAPAWGFDGTGAALAPSASINPTLSAPFAVELVIDIDPTTSGNRLLIANGSGTGSTLAGFNLRLISGNGLRFLLIKDGSNFVGIDTPAGVVPQGGTASMITQLAHIVAAYDGSGAAASACQVWVNGRKQTPTTVAGGTVTTIATSQVIEVAGGMTSLPGFAGFVKNVAYYDRVPAPSEIIEHYKLTAYGPVVPLANRLRRGLVGAGASSAIKTINGVPIANVKTINGLARASVKTVDGLA